MTAVRPLTRSKASDDTPVRLVERGGDLVLESYSYRGEEVDPAQLIERIDGRVQCGFYLEMAERKDYADGAAFGERVASGTVRDETAPPGGEGKRLWTVEYRRGGKTLGIEVDLAEWALERRWNQDGDLGFPMLESSVARQNADGRVEVGSAILTCGKAPAWLFAPPGTGRYVAGLHATKPAPVTLTVPAGTVQVAAMGTGTIVWDNGEVTVEATDLEGTPRLTGGRLLDSGR